MQFGANQANCAKNNKWDTTKTAPIDAEFWSIRWLFNLRGHFSSLSNTNAEETSEISLTCCQFQGRQKLVEGAHSLVYIEVVTTQEKVIIVLTQRRFLQLKS